MTRYILAFVLFALFSYGLVEAWPLLMGPSLSISTPIEAESFPNGLISATGIATRAAHLTLNGTEVLREKDGHFSTPLTFPQGASILTFVATDRFGRHVSVTRSIFVPN